MIFSPYLANHCNLSANVCSLTIINPLKRFYGRIKCLMRAQVNDLPVWHKLGSGAARIVVDKVRIAVNHTEAPEWFIQVCGLAGFNMDGMVHANPNKEDGNVRQSVLRSSHP